jgi:hypothetical protein
MEADFRCTSNLCAPWQPMTHILQRSFRNVVLSDSCNLCTLGWFVMSIRRSGWNIVLSLVVSASAFAADPAPILAQESSPIWDGIQFRMGEASVDFLIWLLQTQMDASQNAIPPEVAPQTQQTLSQVFPLSACGDALPSSYDAYPLAVYPVQIRYTEANLDIVQTYFCRDVFQGSNGDRITVASFVSEERAYIFAQFMAAEFANAFVGEPDIIDERPF